MPEEHHLQGLRVLASRAPAVPEIKARIRGAFAGSVRGLVPFAQLADAAGVGEDEIRPHAAKVVLADRDYRWSARGLYYRFDSAFDLGASTHLGVTPWTIEKLVLERSTSDLDALLAPSPRMRVRLRDEGRRAPALRWAGGGPLSAGAQRFFLALMTDPTYAELTRLLASIVDDDSLFELGCWLLADPKAHAKDRWILPPSQRLVDELARAHEHGLLTRRPWEYQGLASLASYRRWIIRWSREAEGQRRDALRFAGGRRFSGEVLLSNAGGWLPTAEDIAREQPGSEELWARIVAGALELAMIGQHPIPVHALRRHWLSSPFVASAIRGTLLHVEEHGLVWVDGDGALRTREGRVRPAGHLMAVVAHPLEHGDAGWPTEDEVGTPAPFAQRERACFEPSEMPEPSTLPELPNDTWRSRCQRAGLVELPETDGGFTRAFREAGETQLSIHHAGYGAGLGGARKVAFRRTSVTGSRHPRIAQSELVRDVRMLFGLDPLPPPDPTCPRVPRPASILRALRAPTPRRRR
ncbi:MAG: hypothetical protein KF901_02930 [Myxococcales bacterium]|nr:hypothetical protein [Myxococcales bacterium]